MTAHDVRSTLEALERRGWDALCKGAGGVFYGRTMTDDGVMVLANGELMDRSAVVEALGQAPPWHAYELSEVRLVAAGPDSAVLVYRATADREADGPAFVARMSSVYVRLDDEWRLALYQQTTIPDGES